MLNVSISLTHNRTKWQLQDLSNLSSTQLKMNQSKLFFKPSHFSQLYEHTKLNNKREFYENFKNYNLEKKNQEREKEETQEFKRIPFVGIDQAYAFVSWGKE